MSIEAMNPVEEVPVSKTAPITEQPVVTPPKATETPAVAEATVAAAIASNDSAPAPATENPTTEGNTVVGATPASEGTLGYKEHGFLKSLRYSKHFFWFGEDPSTAESLTHYTKTGKDEHVHHAAAWAQETGNGVMFYTKRAEDKATPAGLILLTDASTVLKEGTTEFSFTVGKIHHRFQANTSTERDSWIVALGKEIEKAKTLKEEITARDSYKKTFEGFSVLSPAPIAARSSSKGPKKSLDAATATAAASEPVAPVAPNVNAETASTSSSDADKKAKKEAEKSAKKERSQSRKRNSIFGILGKKDEEKDLKKEEKTEKKIEKEHIKEEKKVEKEHIKEEKKAEAEIKKEEAKATHDSSKAVEAAEAAAVAAVPAAAIVVADKKEEKKQEEITTPTEKKNKRASVFGSFFGKKGVTSPTTEKTETEVAGPTAPVKEIETRPVSETAPKLEEPIVNKPIDAAAVTAPVDVAETSAPVATTIPTEEPVKEATTTPAADSATPKPEKKGGFLAGLMKKAETKKEEKKEDAHEEKAAEQIAKDPVAAAAAPVTTGTTEAATETPATEFTEAKEERPAREKRRSSFFGALGTIKRKNTETTDAEGTTSEVKREKSPLPSMIGGMFRKPSKAVKSSETDAVGTPVTSTTETGDSKIVGDVVPDELHAVVHSAVTLDPSEVKTSA